MAAARRNRCKGNSRFCAVRLSQTEPGFDGPRGEPAASGLPPSPSRHWPAAASFYQGVKSQASVVERGPSEAVPVP